MLLKLIKVLHNYNNVCFCVITDKCLCLHKLQLSHCWLNLPEMQSESTLKLLLLLLYLINIFNLKLKKC